MAEHDYAAAEAYLSLKLDEHDLAKAGRRLREAPLTSRRANDILRAAGLTPAPLDDPGVMKDLIKVIEGKPLSPVLVLQREENRRHRGRLPSSLTRVPDRSVRGGPAEDRLTRRRPRRCT